MMRLQLSKLATLASMFFMLSCASESQNSELISLLGGTFVISPDYSIKEVEVRSDATVIALGSARESDPEWPGLYNIVVGREPDLRLALEGWLLGSKTWSEAEEFGGVMKKLKTVNGLEVSSITLKPGEDLFWVLRKDGGYALVTNEALLDHILLGFVED